MQNGLFDINKYYISGLLSLMHKYVDHVISAAGGDGADFNPLDSVLYVTRVSSLIIII